MICCVVKFFRISYFLFGMYRYGRNFGFVVLVCFMLFLFFFLLQDMVGVLKFNGVLLLIGFLCVQFFKLFIYVYIYDIVGVGVVFMLVVLEVGVDVVDVVVDFFLGMMLQFSMGVIVVVL